MKIQAMVFWVVMWYYTNVSQDLATSIFREKMVAERSYHITTWYHNPEHDFVNKKFWVEIMSPLFFECFNLGSDIIR